MQRLLRYKSSCLFPTSNLFPKTFCLHPPELLQVNRGTGKGTGISRAPTLWAKHYSSPLTYFIPLNPFPLTHEVPSTNVETKTQRGLATCLSSHSQQEAGSGLEPRSASPRGCALTLCGLCKAPYQPLGPLAVHADLPCPRTAWHRQQAGGAW